MSRTETVARSGSPGRGRRAPSAAGSVLRYWRAVRNLSQLDLALESGVSPRHVCFVETGRSKPSRETVLRLAGALDIPYRERNTLLLAAGYAPIYTEAPPDLAPAELAPVREALDAILRQQEPYPAVVMNRHWEVLRTNEAAGRFFDLLLTGTGWQGPANVVRMMLDPAALRPFVKDWESVADALIQRVHREALGGVPDEGTRQLLAEVLALPGMPRREVRPKAEPPALPVIPITFEKGGRIFRYFSTVTTLGTPQDVLLQELRVECFFPLDAETRERAAELAAGGASAKRTLRDGRGPYALSHQSPWDDYPLENEVCE